MMISDTWLHRLQEHGYRLTAPRRAVAESIAGSTRALTPLEVYETARSKNKGIGLVSVYRTLEKLEELGLIQRVHQSHGCQAFIAAAQGHEHLLLCTRCGAAQRFSGDEMEDLITSIEKQFNYRITEHWLQLFGLCAACRATQ